MSITTPTEKPPIAGAEELHLPGLGPPGPRTLEQAVLDAGTELQRRGCARCLVCGEALGPDGCRGCGARLEEIAPARPLLGRGPAPPRRRTAVT